MHVFEFNADPMAQILLSILFGSQSSLAKNHELIMLSRLIAYVFIVVAALLSLTPCCIAGILNSSLATRIADILAFE